MISSFDGFDFNLVLDPSCLFVYLFVCSGSFPGANHHPAREPRVAADHTGLRFLRRVPEEIRERQRVEVLHRPVRLPAAHRAGRWTGGSATGGRRPPAVYGGVFLTPACSAFRSSVSTEDCLPP